MINLLELINDYYLLIGALEISNFDYNSLDTDISKEEGLFNYFYDFKSYDNNKYMLFLKQNGINEKRLKEIVNTLSIITDIYNKYHVNSIDELEKLIVNVWNANKFYSDTLIKNVLVIESVKKRFSKMVKFNESLLPIYKDMVTLGMITNPNLPVGSSDERIYVKLPEDSSCYEYNLKVLGDFSIDWSIYRNGCNPLGHYCFCYENSKTEEEKKYYHDVILTALASSCSLFNDVFIKNSFKDKDIINYFLVCETDTYEPQCKLKDIAFSDEIKKFILTDKIFEHQLKLYKDINPVASEVIKRLTLLRNS